MRGLLNELAVKMFPLYFYTTLIIGALAIVAVLTMIVEISFKTANRLRKERRG